MENRSPRPCVKRTGPKPCMRKRALQARGEGEQVSRGCTLSGRMSDFSRLHWAKGTVALVCIRGTRAQSLGRRVYGGAGPLGATAGPLEGRQKQRENGTTAGQLSRGRLPPPPVSSLHGQLSRGCLTPPPVSSLQVWPGWKLPGSPSEAQLQSRLPLSHEPSGLPLPLRVSACFLAWYRRSFWKDLIYGPPPFFWHPKAPQSRTTDG